MNLHWARTLEHNRWMVRARPRNKPNYSIPFAYNYTEDKAFWDSLFIRAVNRSANHSALHQDSSNNFHKKSNILSDMKQHKVRTQSFTTVIVISSMFLFLTMTITAAVIVFCRKRNTVFALQKCEQEDDDQYEMEDIDVNTDAEYTSEYEESDIEGEESSGGHSRSSRRHSRRNSDSIDPLDSPLHCPLMLRAANMRAAGVGGGGGSPCDDSDNEDYPMITHHCFQLSPSDTTASYPSTSDTNDNRGIYQRVVVTAVMENPHLQNQQSVSSDEEAHVRTKLMQKLHKKYKEFARLHSELDADFETIPMKLEEGEKVPAINGTYADDPPAYDSLSYTVPEEEDYSIKKKTLDMDNKYAYMPSVELTELPVKGQCDTCKSCNGNLYVQLPNIHKGSCKVDMEGAYNCPIPYSPTVMYVDLPQKSDSSDDNYNGNYNNNAPKRTRHVRRPIYTKPTHSASGTPVYEKPPALPKSVSLPVTPIQELPPTRVLLQSGGSSASTLHRSYNPSNADSSDSLTTALETTDLNDTASWSDLRSTGFKYQKSPSLTARPSQMKLAKFYDGTDKANQSSHDNAKVPEQERKLALPTCESGIDMSSEPPSVVNSPLSPPPGFKNEDCFVSPSSTNDSGVMMGSSDMYHV